MRSNRTPETTLFIAVNTPVPCAEGAGYVALQVGRALAPERFAPVGDDTGDHISGFNPSFCELTGLYWIWKNNNSHVVGLMHYRRYFAPMRQHGLAFGDHHVAQTSDFEELARGVDIVVPTVRHWHVPLHSEMPETLQQQYGRYHHATDLFLAREEALRRTPEYRDAFDFVLAGNTISHHNMFVARKAAIDEYCAWMFPILFAIEPHIPYEFYDRYQSRVFGFISERLFAVWLCHNRRRFRILTRELVRTEPNIL